MSALSIMGERIERLNRVARDGDIEAFYSLIRDDEKILEDIDALPFVDTPLHTIASAEPNVPIHIKFAMEMMRLKPSFARKPNPNGYSPIHLALQKGHTQMVHRLLQVDGDLFRVKGKEGRTPLHDVAAAAETEQQLALMDKFLSYCPNSIEDVTIQNQTALHIALEKNNLNAFKRLVRWLQKNKSENAKEILNRQDEEGNTVLHVALSKNQTEAMQAVRHLVECGATFFNVNEKNLEGQTALAIFEGQQRQVAVISEMKKLVVDLKASCLGKRINRVRKPISDEKRNALLVVAALLVTVTYQAILSPPGGLWQDHLFEANTTDVLRRSPDELFKLNITAPHRAGSATARGTFPFSIFMAFNSIIFLSSIATMAVLVPPDRIVGAILAGVSVSLYFGYFSSLMILTQAPDWLARIVITSSIITIAVGYAFFHFKVKIDSIAINLRG